MSEEDKEGGIGPSLFSKIGDIIGPLMPMLLGLFAVFFAIKKFFPDSGLSKMLPDLPGFLGGEDKEKKEETTGKTEKIDHGRLLSDYFDDKKRGGNGNGTLDQVERNSLATQLGKLKKPNGEPLTDLELVNLYTQVKAHKEELEPLVKDALDKNGKLTDAGFEKVAKKALSYTR